MTVFGVSSTAAVIFAFLAVLSGFVKAIRGLGFTLSVLAVGSAAVMHPPLFIAWGGLELKSVIGPLVQLILFGMGMTLDTAGFRRILTAPRGVAICCLLHYTIMPLAGYCFARLFGLTGAVATGLILIGSVPSGSSSNVMALLAGANVPLSVAVTATSTLISPLVTPYAMHWLAGAYLPVDASAMTASILRMIVTPLAIGLLVRRWLPAFAVRAAQVLPIVAMISICTIIGVTIALSREQLLAIGLPLFAASACLNATGYILGFWGGRLAGLDHVDSRTTSFEVGMQNGGMATGLAFGVLNNPSSALASAIFGPWSAVTASLLAARWRNRKGESDFFRTKDPPVSSSSDLRPVEEIPPIRSL